MTAQNAVLNLRTDKGGKKKKRKETLHINLKKKK